MSNEINHFIFGARTDAVLVRHDDERYDLLAHVERGLGKSIFAHNLLDTHGHVVAEVPADHGIRWLTAALTPYVRAYNKRHGLQGELLRGPITAIPAHDPDALARQIRYVHDQPLDTKPPLVEDAVDWPWGSARAWAGLSLATMDNVARAVVRLEGRVGRVAGGLGGSIAMPYGRGPGAEVRGGWRLADLDPAAGPTARVEIILAAAADTFGVPPWAIVEDIRDGPTKAARAVYFRLGQLEAYDIMDLAAYIRREGSAAYRALNAAPPPDRAVRIARTLLHEPGIRRRLIRKPGPPPPAPPAKPATEAA